MTPRTIHEIICLEYYSHIVNGIYKWPGNQPLMMQLDVNLSFKHRSQNCSCVSWISSDTISPLQKLWPKKDHRVSKGPGLVVLIERLLFCIHAFIAAI